MSKVLSIAVLFVTSFLFLSTSYALVTCTATNARGMSFAPVTGPYHFAWTSAYNECLAISRFCTISCTGPFTPNPGPLWRCSAQGPAGGMWNGVGPTQQSAMSSAMNVCYSSKNVPGPCAPIYSSCYMQ
jgi:hypothetical protein